MEFYKKYLSILYHNCSIYYYFRLKNPMSLPSLCLDPDAVLKDNSSLIKWRNGIPNYSKAHQLFDKHKSTNHRPGSIEDLVQNLVQNWGKGLFLFFLIIFFFKSKS